MNPLDDITVLIITYNEAPNIKRTLKRLNWASHIIVIDSGSTDDTLEIISQHPKVRLFYRNFDTFADQCNFGLDQVSTSWVLSLDADYELSQELVSELGRLESENVVGYRATFVYRIFGHPLRGCLYPSRVILFRVDCGRYVNEGHGHRINLCGNIKSVDGCVYHDDRKPLSRWLSSQKQYASVEADFLLSTESSVLNYRDKIRLWGWPAPLVVFVYTLIWKRCILDGWPGWLYVLQRTLAEILLALEIVDRRLRRTD